jgi:hypothetical protein
VQRTVIFVEMINFPRFEGAAHRNIKFNVTVRLPIFATNITVRCTFKLDVALFCYKYNGALHLKFLQVRSTF